MTALPLPNVSVAPGGRLLVRTPYPRRLLLTMPRAEVLSEGLVEVPDTPQTRAHLRRIGVDGAFRAHALEGYDWPGQFHPMAHQKVTTEFLLSHQRCLVANEIGTGKTLSVLWALDALARAGEMRRALVIAPKSTLHIVWADEAFRTLSGRGLTATVLAAPKESRLEGLRSDASICIVNPEGLPQIYDAARGQFDVVVVDEAALFRTPSSQRFRGLNRWLSLTQHERMRLWLLTGTPTPNAPTDAWALAKLLRSPTAPRSFTAARDVLMRQVRPFRWVPQPDAAQRVAGFLQPSIRFKRSECLDLPPTTTQAREVTLTPEQASLYEGMVREYIVELEQGELVAANEGVKAARLLQIAAGAVYLSHGGRITVPTGPRIDQVLDIVGQATGKALVYSPYRGPVGNLVSALEGVGGYRVGVVHGGVSKGRSELFHRFQEPRSDEEELDVLVAVPGAMSHGLTLTAATTIVWYSPPWSLEIYEQACGRIERRGKTVPCTVVHLQATDLERQVYARLEAKRSLQGTLLNMLEERG